MAKNSVVTDEDNVSIKEMSLNGVAPADIAVALNISVSSVNRYKKMWIDKGIKFPILQGRRPARVILSNDSMEGINGERRFIVNGVSIIITGEPLQINIGPDSINVDY